MTDSEQSKPREMHITKKTTRRNRHKWDEGAEQRQRQIFRLKVWWCPTWADNLTAWKQKHSLTKPQHVQDRGCLLSLTDDLPQGLSLPSEWQVHILKVANENLKLLHLLAFKGWHSARRRRRTHHNSAGCVCVCVCVSVCYLLVIGGPDTTCNLAFQVDLGGPVSLPADWTHQDEAVTVGDKSLGAVVGPGEVTHLQGNQTHDEMMIMTACLLKNTARSYRKNPPLCTPKLQPLMFILALIL